MSDAAAPAPAAETAPAAPTPESAPAETPKPVDPLAELDERIAKAGLKVKVGGKERPVQSMREALRALERVGGVEARLAEVAAREQQAQAILERETRLKAAKSGRERAAILREFAGDAFDEAAEEAILERIEREKQMADMTPREREMAQALAEREQRLAAYEAEKQKAEELQRAQAEEAELSELRERLAGVAVKTLQAAGLSKTAAPDAGRRLAFLMSRAQKLGLDLDESDLAPKLIEHARSDTRSYLTGLKGPALLEWLGDDVVREVTRAAVARAEGRPTASLPKPDAQPKPRQEREETRSMSPMAAWNSIAKGLK